MKQIALLVGLSFVFTLSGCLKSQTRKPVRAPLQEFIFNLRTEPPTLDWNRVEDTTSRVVIDNIMEPLISYDYSSPEAKLVPGLASDWISMDDGRKWVVTIRSDLKWSDGQPLKVEHARDSFERLLNPKTGAMGSDDFFVIKNAQAYNEGKLKDFSKVGIEISGPSELTFSLNKPLVFFPYLLSLPQVSPIRKDVIAKHGDQWTEPENIVTIGAYTLKTWKHDQSITLVANRDYFRPQPDVKKVTLLMVGEDSTAVNLFETGKLDVQFSMPSLDLPRLQKKKEYSSFTNSCVAFLVFNTELPPMDDPWIRRAISHALNRQEMVQLLGGGRKANRGWLPHGLLGFDEGVGLEHSAEKAKAALARSKYKTAEKVPPIQIYYNTHDNYKPLFELIQSQIKTNLGIKAEVFNLEWKSYLQFIRSKMPHVHRMGWIGTYQDPDIMMRPLMGGKTSINASWQSDRYNQLVEKGMSEFDPKKRGELYKEATRIVVEKELPIYNIYTCAQQYLVSEKVDYYPFNKEARDLFRFVRLKKSE